MPKPPKPPTLAALSTAASASVTSPRRLEIGAAPPAAPILDDILSYLHQQGFTNAAEALTRNFPSSRLPEHAMVFDVNYGAADNGQTILPEAAAIAFFGQVAGRGPEVAAQSWRDAALFVQTDALLPDLRDLLAELDEHWATMRPLMDELRSYLASLDSLDIAPGTPTATAAGEAGEKEAKGA